MFSLPLDYFLLVFFACCGVIQLAAAYSGLAGMLIVPRARAGYLLGCALVVGSFAWFAAIGDFAIPGDVGGVEGAQQFGLFLGAAVASVAATNILASLRRLGSRKRSTLAGMDALREGTYLELALGWLLRKRRDGQG